MVRRFSDLAFSQHGVHRFRYDLDDPVHEVLGIHGKPWRSLYHFTFGHGVEDVRLSTLPAYEDD